MRKGVLSKYKFDEISPEQSKFFSKSYKVLAKKVKKSYLSWNSDAKFKEKQTLVVPNMT